jgi:hypothetical protein
MCKNGFVRIMGVRKRTLVIVAALMVSVGGLGVISPVMAKEPTGDYAIFRQCPRFTTGVNLCLYSQIKGGGMTLGKLTVPIVNTVTFQGGIIKGEVPPFAEAFVGALNGESLSATPQPVPGGLSSLIDCSEIKGRGFLGRARRRACRAVFENPWFRTVNATTELAGPASEIGLTLTNELREEGVALSMPVRVHLENPLLGKGCYIGSSVEPIVFNLTTGTTSPPPPNKPINGSFGFLSQKDNFEFIEVAEHVQVDNAFPAPEAMGCGGPFSSFIDPLIDGKIGLASPAGYNTIIHSGSADEATTVGVIGSEKEDEPGEHETEKRDHGTGRTPWRHWNHD